MLSGKCQGIFIGAGSFEYSIKKGRSEVEERGSSQCGSSGLVD